MKRGVHRKTWTNKKGQERREKLIIIPTSMNTNTKLQHQLDILIAATIAESKGKSDLRNDIVHAAESAGISLEQLHDTNEALACAAANVDREHWLFDDEEAQALLLFAQVLDVCREAIYANGQIYLIGDDERQSDRLDAIFGLPELLRGLDLVLQKGANITGTIAAFKKFNRLRNEIAFGLKDRWAKGDIHYKQKLRAKNLLDAKEAARVSVGDVRGELHDILGDGTLRGRTIRLRTGRGFETRLVSLVRDFRASRGCSVFIDETLAPAIENLSWDAADNADIADALHRLEDALEILRRRTPDRAQVCELLKQAASSLYGAEMPVATATDIAIRCVDGMEITNIAQALHQFNSVYVKQRPDGTTTSTIDIKVYRLRTLLVYFPELLDFVITMRSKHPEVANAFADLWPCREYRLRSIARPDLDGIEARVEILSVSDVTM